MTISYAGEVPNASSFGCFWKILWKWRGSVYKLVWRELLAYLLLYYTINLLHRFVLSEHQQKIFNKLRLYFGKQSESIPMSFVLGFYVNLVVKRWWEQYRLLPWPDTLALFISAAIPNSNGGVNNETGRLMRRNIMRYMVLAYVITLQRISLRVKRRFPSTQHLVDAGLMHESEMKIFDALNQRSPMSKYWMPLVWATNIINRARKEGLIASDHIVQTILVELSDIRRRLGGLIGYDTVCVPLVYTQVVTLVLYTYFIAALLGRQMLPNSMDQRGNEDPDLYFPLFTVLQFIFYVGWLKVAEVLINPFGEDDDDIELNWLIDRHIKAAYMIVDEMHEEHPELLRDQYWECVVPKDLPYTVASEHYRRNEPKGSAENYKIKKEDAMYANIISSSGKRGLVDDVYADYESVDTPMVERRKNNWLVRQLSRMGSIRSQATSYSSGGIAYNRNRINSVYSSPESGLPLSIIQQQQQHQGQLTQQQQQHQHQHQQQSKPSLYEKFVHGKSLRAQKQLMKQNSRMNGLSANPPKPRPRIPTPDITKEIGEKDKSMIAPNQTHLAPSAHLDSTRTTNASLATTQAVLMTPTQSSTSTNTAALTHNAIYPYTSQEQATNQVVGTLWLSPIKEMDCSSAQNTLIPGHAATTALAQTVSKANLKDGVGFGVNSSIPSTTSITTRSFPFTVTTSPADTISSGATLNILPITTAQIPKITSNSNGLIDVNTDGQIATIPFPVSVELSSSTGSINELVEQPDEQNSIGGGGGSAAGENNISSSNRNVGNGDGILSSGVAVTPTTTALLNVKPLNLNASVDRSSSIRSAGHAVTYDDTSTTPTQQQQSIDRTDGKSNSSSPNSISAPSTLAKRNPESKTGEVYV